ncbi:MAG: hypothetical protein ACRENE_14965 [Polyangiaceae bacterium]
MRYVVVPLTLLASLSTLAGARADDSQRVPLAPDSVYVEALGAGLAESLNYERIIADRFALRVGAGMFTGGMDVGNDGVHRAFFAFPVTVSYVGVRAHGHALEVGSGVTVTDEGAGRIVYVYAAGSGEDPKAFGAALVGYRFQPEGHAGLQIRVGAMVLAGNGLALYRGDIQSYEQQAADAGRFGVIPWGYLSVGASF